MEESVLGRLRRGIGDLVTAVRIAVKVPTAVIVSFLSRPEGGYQHVWCSENARLGAQGEVPAELGEGLSGRDKLTSTHPEQSDSVTATSPLQTQSGESVNSQRLTCA